MQISILGCGPSGLVAAHAATRLGHDVNIFSIKKPSPIYGAQYLHQPIPGLLASQGDPRMIRYVMQGEPESYLKKVYGAEWDGTISDDLRDQAHLAWDIRRAYAELWLMYEGLVIDIALPVDHDDRVRAMVNLVATSDMVVNTIPRDKVCVWPARHRFVSTPIWALGDTPERAVPIPTEEGVILYNGDSEPSWYRTSSMYGYSTVEWPGHLPRPPLPGVARVNKPLSHDCDCFPGVVHLGRMGRWQNGRLVHHVYADMWEQIKLRELAA
jgi:hypothetical protein